MKNQRIYELKDGYGELLCQAILVRNGGEPKIRVGGELDINDAKELAIRILRVVRAEETYTGRVPEFRPEDFAD
ncbi:MAG: hypothetical protein CUN55_00470 [Phototrophicales bacterium]|nr:MAG: hypothetical protein CUN55_00470 [Phototrophicales bacterium]